MPRVVSYTPAWLQSPSAGNELFSPSNDQTFEPGQVHSEKSRRNARPGPRRTIARRGTEVFVAVGKEIRWGDLVQLKSEFEDKHGDNRHEVEDDDEDEELSKGYRILKTPVADDIRQLVISPHGNLMAILTTHTVHIALLPDSSHLTTSDISVLKLKAYTLGSVTHVTTQAAVVSALWHPLGVNGNCIVTVTQDAVVRVWELSTTDRWSFDRPTLAIDLQKLVDGTAVDQDFSASVSGAKKGFSPDSVEMEVAAACFGGRGSGGWSPMTLWVAMREGDVYALCPLLPEKWAPPPTLIPSLSCSIVAKVASLEDDLEAPQKAKLLAQQQLAWMGDLDNQSPTVVETPSGELPAEVYARPQRPGRIPKLQGPFEFELALDDSEDELDSLLSDIHVIGGKVNAEELMFGEEDELEMDDLEQEGLSLGVVCLLTSSGRLSICLDLEGVEAQWLPNTKSKVRRFADVSDPPSLLMFQTLDILRSEELYDNSWPMFSQDVTSRYSLFTTHASGVTFISLTPWAFRLESELQNSSSSGIDFRIDLLVKGQNSIRQRIISRQLSKDAFPTALAACVAIQDPDLGYFLLTASPHRAIAVSFEAPEGFEIRRSRSPTFEAEPEPQPLLLCAPREVYQAAPVFSSQSALPNLLGDLRRSKYKRMIAEPVRLSPATLTILTDAHKVLSEETHRIGMAAAELFRRCERLQIELRDQISQANEVANRIEAVTGDDKDFDDSHGLSGNEALQNRIRIAAERQQSLTDRLESSRKKAARGGNVKELSDKEKLWIDEISSLEENIIPESSTVEWERNLDTAAWQRFEKVKALAADLLDEVGAVDQESTAGDEDLSASIRVPNEVRRQKVAQVMRLLEREQALVEGTKGRLERLTLG